MSSNVDEIIDRRKLRKKVSFWRIATFLVLGLCLLGLVLSNMDSTSLSAKKKDHIAKVKISGVITNDKPMLKLIEKLRDEEKVKAVILEISSPGGSTVGGETLYYAVRELAEKKPVATQVGTLAASAGYMIACASDHIVSHRSSIVGSIGVIFQYPEFTELMEKVGVRVNAIKSSPLKAEPNYFTPTSDEARQMIDSLVKDSYKWFVGLVAERRNMSKLEAYKIADGSVFTGNQGLKNGLVDDIGGEEKILTWLEKEKEISQDLKIVVYKPKRETDNFYSKFLGIHRVAQMFGINLQGSEAQAIEKYINDRLLLDGLISFWQVSR